MEYNRRPELMTDQKMTCVSDEAETHLLTAVYNSVYADTSLFANIQLLNKAICDSITEFKELLHDRQYVHFCTDNFIDKIENAIDRAIDDKENTALRNAAVLHNAVTGLCSYTLVQKTTNQMLDHKYAFKSIIDLVPNLNNIYSGSAEYLNLSDVFRRELATELDEFEDDLYNYSTLNYFEIGCICIFLNKRTVSHRCRFRG